MGMPSRGDQPRFKAQACLLSSGFYRHVYASLASVLRLFALQKTTRTTTTTTTMKRRRTDVGSLCCGPRLFVYVSGGLMAPALHTRLYLLLSFLVPTPPAATGRSESFKHLTFMEYLEISVLPTSTAKQSSDCSRPPSAIGCQPLLSTGTSDFVAAMYSSGTRFECQ